MSADTTAPAALGDALSARADAALARVQQAATRDGVALPDPVDWPGDWQRVLAVSEYVADRCCSQPALLAELLDTGALSDAERAADVSALAGAPDDAALCARLRRARHLGLLRIAWRDLGGLATLDQTLAQTSALAEALTAATLARLTDWQREKSGTPRDADGRPVALLVMALGKLGARELNFSSDVDVIYAYEADGETDRERRPLSNHEFFIKLAQALGGTMSRVTADGFGYRVDTRLRPFGGGGPLVSSFASLEDYYEVHGRPWERCALTRLAVIGDDDAAAHRLKALLEPFVYRRYPDFSALEALRDIKRAIAAEARQRGGTVDLKKGRGGIREAEFVVQALQVACGGRDTGLRDSRTLVAMRALASRQLLPADAARDLENGYRYLRRLENCVQMLADEQTHDLPADEPRLARVVAGVGAADLGDLRATLAGHSRRIAAAFDALLGGDEDSEQTDDEAGAALGMLLVGESGEAQWPELLRSAGLPADEGNLQGIANLVNSRAVRGMDAGSRDRLRKLGPQLLSAVAGVCEQYPDCLIRVLHLLESIARRSAYLVLLLERPNTLTEVVRLIARSERAARELTERPVLLDELVGDPDSQGVSDLLRARVLAARDEEEELAVLREFVAGQRLLAIRESLPAANAPIDIEAVSARLVAAAEAVLEQAMRLARRDIVARHGECRLDSGAPMPIVMLAYGRLGAREMGLDSDLDLVLVREDREPALSSDGPKPLDPQTFAERVAQRLNHLLVTRTLSGLAYEVDFRLRPRGKGGPLCPGGEARTDYRASEAWVYERQALVRARVLDDGAAAAAVLPGDRTVVLGARRAGQAAPSADPATERAASRLHAAVDSMRRDALRGAPADPALATAVREMRERMAGQLGRQPLPECAPPVAAAGGGAGAGGGPDTGARHLRNDAGGTVDAEFVLQYLVLRHAVDCDGATASSRTDEQLRALAAAGLVPAETADALAAAHLALRRAGHVAALHGQAPVSDSASLVPHRAAVARAYDHYLAAPAA